MMRAGAAPARARAGLVLLHGRGGSASGIIALGTGLGLPDIAMIAPEAPGNSWWPSPFLSPSAVMEQPLAKALAAVAGAIDTLVSEGLPRNRIWLAGFSQGACLSLEAFARQGDGLAGVFALSGGLIGTADAPDMTPRPELYGHAGKRFDYTARRDGIPVWLSVSEQDPHIPLARARQSADVLRTLGADVTLHVVPGRGHSVLAEDVARMRALLNTP